MKKETYLINNREYSLVLPLSDELNFNPDKNYLFELPHLNAMNVTGARATEFLQGQLSCDVNQVNSTTMRQGSLCNLKGRVQALLDIINWQGYKLVLPADLLHETMASLAKTAMVSRVTLQHTFDFKVYGFYLSNPDDLLPNVLTNPLAPFAAVSNEKNYCYAIGDNFYLIITSDEGSQLAEPFIKQQQLRGSLGWHRLQLERPRVEIYPQTRGTFLPHRLDLHKRNYISFDKGCYKGQEIIARTHYRAKLKHGLGIFSIHCNEPLSAGKKIFDLTDRAEAGELIDFCPLSPEQYLIVASMIHDHPSMVQIEDQEEAITLNSLLSF
jgi:tRNA-modifying protein YgfZ